MAYITNTHGAARSDIMGRTAAFFKNIGERMEQYRTYRRTLTELSQLSERELADLGINRAMINTIATEAAYGA
ncbi:DUF1127 domain-containing protein [Oceaniglobus trochenteri]|uniref:DUF1127 domain-containing protein n=1 Tax=Oceaniglobus trochenteri TaxID=2763260 RepID=UPI001D0004B5|nr:DUF1127 domain-containing protein [Oceaniglobus trochenteri]